MKCPRCKKTYTKKDYVTVLLNCMYWDCGLTLSTAKVLDKKK